MKANSRYLTLALHVRKITDSLINLAEGGHADPALAKMLPEMLVSLETSEDRTSVQRLRESGSFGNYENIITVNEVFVRPEDRKAMIRRIQQVLGQGSDQDRREGAIAAIPFLDAIERRALYRYSRPQVDRRVSVTR